MSAILRVRQQDGTIVEIPAIIGPAGPQGPPGPAGAGTGDMNASVYDPQGRATDIYEYVDDKLQNIEVKAEDVVFDDGETFQKKLDDGELVGPAGADGAPGPAGADGDPGIYYGTDTPPTDGSVLVWVNPSGTPDIDFAEEVEY